MRIMKVIRAGRGAEMYVGTGQEKCEWSVGVCLLPRKRCMCDVTSPQAHLVT